MSTDLPLTYSYVVYTKVSHAMTVVDAQVHAFERNHRARPWTGAGSPIAQATGDATVDLMDASGVDAAILVSPWLNYLADASYAYDTAAAHPGRFAVVAPVDPSPTDPVEFVAKAHEHSSLVGMRLTLWSPVEQERVADRGYSTLLDELALRGLPLCVALGSTAEPARLIAQRHPALTVVIDHLGLGSASTPPAPDDPFTRLPEIMALAELPNVAIKATGMPALSHQPHPYSDLREPLHRLLEAFTPRRVLWGTDRTRTHAFLSYAEGVSWITEAGLSSEELALVMGGSARQLFSLDRVLR